MQMKTAITKNIYEHHGNVTKFSRHNFTRYSFWDILHCAKHFVTL